jgi:protein-tyrosine phosphatase
MSTWDAQEVIPRLWLGSEDAAHSDLATIQKHNISHILVVGFGLSTLHAEHLKYAQVNAIDLPVYSILKDVPKCMDFIESGLNEGSGVLVHCARGVSRSASIVIAYIMVSKKVSYEEAYNIVRTARKIISPNSNFTAELKEFYKNGCDVSKLRRAPLPAGKIQ